MIVKLMRRLRGQPAVVPTLASLDAYQKWATTYPPQAHNALMQLEQQTLTTMLPAVHGKRVLDLAGGSGRYGIIAREQGAAVVICIDNSADMLAVNPLQERVQAHLEAIPLPGESVDVIVCALALGHLPQISASIGEMARILKPGGYALISDIHPFVALTGAQRTFAVGSQLFAVEHHVHLYSAYHRAVTAAGLTIDVVTEAVLSRETQPAATNLPVIIVYRLKNSG
jgi:malonyl-CoA O-methyltransferase